MARVHLRAVALTVSVPFSFSVLRSDVSIGREEEEWSRNLLSVDLLVLRTMDSLRVSQV